MLRTNRVKRKMHAGARSFGAWLHLCNGLSAEIMGDAGFDWIMIDMEHGHGDLQTLMTQLQAMGHSDTVPIVRVPWNDGVIMKRVLDIGVYGVMVPWVNTREEAENAVQGCKYPPEGMRGLARNIRATSYGRDFPGYPEIANEEIMVIVQIETTTAIDNIHDILTVPGVDVVFIGPSDLSASMKILGQYDHPALKEAIATIEAAAKEHNVALGTLCTAGDQLKSLVDRGYQFLSMGSDASFVLAKSQELKALYDSLE